VLLTLFEGLRSVFVPLTGTTFLVFSRCNSCGCPLLRQLLLVALCSFRHAAIVTDAGYTDPNGASCSLLTKPLDRFTLPSPSTLREPSEISCFQMIFPPLRLSGAPPPICLLASTPPELSLEIGPWVGDHGSCSAPVGSHHFDGLLRGIGSRPVASRYRTWGSLGFCRANRRRPKTTRTRSTFPPALDPPKVYSSSAAVPHRWGLLPKTVRSKATLLPLDSTSPRRR
jgi:hypothetical protein